MVSRLDRNRPLPEPQRARVDDPATQRAFDSIYEAVKGTVDTLQPVAQPEKWQPALFYTGWENYGPTVQNAASKKDPLGRVHLRGHVKRTAGALTEIFLLPKHHWPALEKNFTITSAGAFGAVYVTSGGVVTFYVGNAADVALEGVSFDTEE